MYPILIQILQEQMINVWCINVIQYKCVLEPESVETFSREERLQGMEQTVSTCEHFIVQLTQIRADAEDAQIQSSPKKLSKFKSSMKKHKREGSKHSSSSISSNVTEGMVTTFW